MAYAGCLSLDLRQLCFRIGEKELEIGDEVCLHTHDGRQLRLHVAQAIGAGNAIERWYFYEIGLDGTRRDYRPLQFIGSRILLI